MKPLLLICAAFVGIMVICHHAQVRLDELQTKMSELEIESRACSNRHDWLRFEMTDALHNVRDMEREQTIAINALFGRVEKMGMERSAVMADRKRGKK